MEKTGKTVLSRIWFLCLCAAITVSVIIGVSTADAFKNNGLGDIVSSWVSTGRNLPVSADQILQVLGPERIQQIAQKAGVSTENLSQQLAVYLPRSSISYHRTANYRMRTLLKKG